MYAGSEFPLDGVVTENAREVKLFLMLEYWARRFVLEVHKALDGRKWVISSVR